MPGKPTTPPPYSREPRRVQRTPDDGAALRAIPRKMPEFSKVIAAPKSGERWLLVTSAYHMPRSVGLFRKAGFAVEPYPVNWRTGKREDILAFSPLAVEGLERTDIGIREWMAWPLTGSPARSMTYGLDPSETSGGGRNRRSIGLVSRQRAHGISSPIGSSRHATANTAGTVRYGRHRRRFEQPASAEDHRDRHEDVCNRR